MVALALGFAVGLVVGWNLLPQPDWALAIYERVAAKFQR
jgi:hypothetical protein